MEEIFKLSDDGKTLVEVLDMWAEHITIPDGVEVIGERAFIGCSSLQSVDIPDSVVEIGESAFYDCESLQSIDIPNSVEEIGMEAFIGCESLQSVDIPDSVEEIGEGAFGGCLKLQSINVAAENQFYASIDGVLYNKQNTTIIRIPQGADFETFSIPDSVTEIENYAFSYCSKLRSVDIHNGVTRIGDWAFRDCYALQSIDIPESVTEIGEGVFSYCESLQSIHMHSTDVNELDVGLGLGIEFSKCTLYVPAGMKEAYIDIMEWEYGDYEIIEREN